MKLAELADRVPGATVRGDPATIIQGLAYHTRDVADGTLFFCVPGQSFDGHTFADRAVAAGAAALVCERDTGQPVTQLLVPSVRRAMALMAAHWYGDPSRELRTVGVTGTNGKTTTAHLLAAVFAAAGLPAGLLGTVVNRIGGHDTPVKLTTAESLDLQRMFREMLAAGDRACALEVSSHALAQDRAVGIAFDAAVFTNLTRDHLDYHATLDDYFAAKRRLFLPDDDERGAACAVVNVGGEHGRRLAGDCRPAYADDLWTFAVESQAAAGAAADAPDARARDLELTADASAFTLQVPRLALEERVTLRLAARFNVENALAALTTGLALGLPADAVLRGVAGSDGVPGRFEAVRAGQPFSVIIDYSHTPDSLENALRAARAVTSGRVLVVFGCGGDRDRGKRPLMGDIGARLADVAFVTSDNPRSEEPLAIIDEIVAGVPFELSAAIVIEPDRRQAIRLALTEAREDDTVVIAGKGHEQGQIIGDQRIPFADRAVAEELLVELGGGGERMLALSLADVALECAGRLESADADAVVASVCTDTRTVAEGDLYVGLRGEHFDGDSFAAAALAGGAAAVVVRPETAARLPAGSPCVIVDDGLAALQRLATAVRRRAGVEVVAITGSAGKTSTKDILAALLRPVSRTVATAGNLNNQVGVPLTLLGIERSTQYVVVEMAMRGPGQIRELARIALPDVAVITTIAPVHLELVGTVEDVAAAKAELIEELDGGTAVVPGDEPLLERHVSRYRGRVVTFGVDAGDVHVVAQERRGGSTHVLIDAFGHRGTLDFSFTGAHYLHDAVAAVAAFMELGFRLDEAKAGAAEVSFSDLRGAVSDLPGGGLLLNDAYNANPLAMKAAVDHLVSIAAGRPPVAVLGDMYELGAGADAFHRAVGEHCAAAGVRLVAVGDLARDYLTGAPGELWFATVEECVAALPDAVPEGSAVLVKASRGLRLERVAAALAEADHA